MDNWISVKDRLPKYNEEVLVWGKFARSDKKFPRIDHYCKADSLGLASWYSTTNVTHWMPLPTAPRK